MSLHHYIQPVSYKRYFLCNNCVLLLVYAINLSLSTDLVDHYGENTFSVKPPFHLIQGPFIYRTEINDTLSKNQKKKIPVQGWTVLLLIELRGLV